MYGRVFEKMYEGSMAGAGLNVFALWNYMLTKARRGAVEINPKLVAFTLGGEAGDLNTVIKQVEDALEYLQRPDPESRSQLEDGRRIIKEGQFQYRIVNWASYEQIRQEAENREYNRFAQAKHRKKIQSDSPTSPVSLPEEFQSFWKLYPKKVSKGHAEKAFIKLGCAAIIDKIAAALEWQVLQESWTKEGGQYIPNPATWLNGKRWEDSPVGEQPGQPYRKKTEAEAIEDAQG